MQQHPSWRYLLLGCRVFGAQQTVGGLVLFNSGEAALQHGVEAVVVGIVVTLADFAQQHIAGAGFHFEIVVQVLGDVNALTGGQLDLSAGGNGVGPAVGVDGDIGFVVNGLIGKELYTRISTLPPPRLMMSSVLYQWKWLGEY